MERGGVSIIVGDALTELRKLESDSVDMICTSPPYWGLRCYGVDGQLGQERTLGEHLEAMVEVLRECRRVLKPSGTCWINYGDCYASSVNGRSAADTKLLAGDDRTFRDKPFSTVGPIHPPAAGNPFPAVKRRGGGNAPSGGYLKAKDLCLVPQRLFIALQEDGWYVRSVLPWVKRNGMPESISDRPANSIEYVGFLTKSPRYWYDAEAVRRGVRADTPARSQRGRGADHKWADDGPGNQTIAKVAPSPGSVIEVDGVECLGRNFRNTDLFFDSLDEPWGLISDSDGTPLAIDATPQAFREAHFATFPPGLISPLIRAGCPVGGTVLDPFGGAGTTGLVAGRLGRNAVLIELNPDYAEMARNRIAADLTTVRADIPQSLMVDAPLFHGLMEAAE